MPFVPPPEIPRLEAYSTRQISYGGDQERKEVSLDNLQLPFYDILKDYATIDDKLIKDFLDELREAMDIILDLELALSQLEFDLEPFKNGYVTTLLTETANKILNNIRFATTGLPIEVETAIYERARHRVLAEATRQTRRIISDISARLPYAGAIGDLLIEADRDVANKLADVSRDIMIEQAKLTYQMERDKIKEAIALEQERIKAWSAEKKNLLEAYEIYNKVIIENHWKYVELMLKKAQLIINGIGNDMVRLLAGGARQLTFENWLNMSKIMAEGQLRIATLIAQC